MRGLWARAFWPAPVFDTIEDIMRPVFLTAAAIGFMTLALVAQSVAPPLGVPPARAKEAVDGILSYGVTNPGLPSAARAFKALSPEARAQAAIAGVAWLKAYVASPDFKKAYADLRTRHKPDAPSYSTTPEQDVEKQHQESKTNPDDVKKMLDALPPDQRKAMEEVLKQTQAQLAALDTPENRKMQIEAVKRNREQEQKQYQEDVAKWGRDYPENPTPLVVTRLKEFLDRTANVDFTAKLTGTGTSQQFANPDYQNKDTDWKMAFRAGKEATAAARTAVAAWLKELGG
jgi:hypothetical protein